MLILLLLLHDEVCVIENYVTYYYNGIYDWKKYANEDLEIELTSYIDSKQNVWS